MEIAVCASENAVVLRRKIFAIAVIKVGMVVVVDVIIVDVVIFVSDVFVCCDVIRFIIFFVRASLVCTSTEIAGRT